MYIKQVIIQGFRSYRDETVIEPFSPRHNVVVGRNGSGKSNFFYAIQFVLSDEFSHLRADERQALLHEGTGNRVITAYVDIVFDNSDNRLPIEKQEVVLRRIIGSKKDQYFLDNKLVTRTDVMNLLETAGFSRSNPYYIVKQGKINMMATAPDSQRLKLLKEVAGTKVYDERKEESFKILEETKSKKTKIEELLRFIEERLNTLESEKEELKQFQKLDKMRRSLEYTIYNTELKETNRKIGDLNRHRDASGDVASQLQSQQSAVNEKMMDLSRELRDVKTKYNAQQDEREQLNSELQDLVKEKARLELTVKDTEKELADEASSRKQAEKELNSLRERIQEAERNLADINPKYAEQYDREEKAKQELSIAEQRRKELYAKQSRGSQFQTKEQRDNWIKKELRGLERAASNKRDQMKRLRDGISEAKTRSEELESKIIKIGEEMESQKSLIDQNNTSFHNKKRDKDNLANKRNTLWREENTLQQALTMSKDELYKQEQSLRSITGKAVLNGIDSVRKVLDKLSQRGEQHTVDGYHGLLIENFHCDKPYYTCVEVTAGSRLFYHVVDTDATSTRILHEMNKLKLPGEVSFMPLNRLEAGRLKFPNPSDQSVKPMIELLEFDDKFKKAFEHVFGKTLICKDINTATHYSNTENLDCITLTGDQVSRRGALTGGFYDNRKSRLELHNGKLELQKQIENQQTECGEHKSALEQVEKEVDAILTEMQKMETRNNKNKDVYEKMKRDLRVTKDEFDRLSAQIPQQERQLTNVESSLNFVLSSQTGLQAEMEQDLNSTLSSEDQQELESLAVQIKQLTEENRKALKERSKLEAQKNQIENKLNGNLKKKEDRLQRELEDIQVEDNSNKFETLVSDLESVDARSKELKSKREELDKNLSKFNAQQKKLQNSLEKCRAEEQDIQSKISDDSKTLERITTKISSLVKKKNDATKKISELGLLPSDTLKKYQDLNLKQLFKKLEETNSDLKKYSHVNKKALDHFMTFSQQKEKFITRNTELDDAHEKIQDLITALDHKKYEAILMTFKQVSKNFTEIFKKLVPQGQGVLNMKTDGPSIDDESEGSQTQNGESQEENADRTLIRQFTGVGIKVSFTGNQAEMRDMQQLSGGQKSLVALALIFSIQKCDPAPFYLFDEIDQALDAGHRKGVADMINELAGDAQFITTTFRPELLEHSDKFYGVRFRNKVSHIDCVTREEAYDFVEDDQQHA